jgi:ataxin-10
MLIYTCCRDNDSRCSDLAEGKGAFVLALLLNRGKMMQLSLMGSPILLHMKRLNESYGSEAMVCVSGGKGVVNAAPNEWLEFLISRLCFANPGLSAVFGSLGDDSGFTMEQACLLDVLNASLSAREEENRTDDPSAETSHCTSMPSTSASFLVEVVRAGTKHAASSNLSALQVPTKSPVADVLGLSLSVTRILCVLDTTRATIIPQFASSGLIPLLLNLLRALGPPDSGKARPASTNIMDSDEQPSSLNDSESFPRRDVYIGYRRDVVAVIANASYRSFLIQELVREHGGLLVVLQQCMPDTNNPFLREWGLWAVRNLLEGNSVNQTELADLEIKSTVPDSRLQEAGMSVEINPETGRPRLVNVAPGTQNPAAVDEFM